MGTILYRLPIEGNPATGCRRGVAGGGRSGQQGEAGIHKSITYVHMYIDTHIVMNGGWPTQGGHPRGIGGQYNYP